MSNSQFPTIYSPLRTPPDLTNCDREPVAFIGCIQPHGALLVARPDSFEVVQHTPNLSTVLPEAPEPLGRSLEALLSPSAFEFLEGLPQREFDRIYHTCLQQGVALAVHRLNDLLYLELEPLGSTPAPARLSELKSILPSLAAAESLEAFTQGICQTVRDYLQVERVMVYQFLPDWTGHIIAESCLPGVSDRYLGLRFPATDIPVPAREVFLRNWLRHIQDTESTPLELVPLQIASSSRPTDLGLSILRAPSPIHVEYLRNMGVRSSVTCSLRVDGKLWGLIACHHHQPILLSQEERSALEFFTELISLRLGAILLRDTMVARENTEKSLAELEIALVEHDTLRLDLELPRLRRLLPCDAVAVLQNGEWWTDGDLHIPELEQLRAGARELPSERAHVAWTNRLPGEPPPYPGVLTPSLGVGPDTEIYWLRRADSYAVRWAGDPRKDSLQSVGSSRLQPRASFEEYVEEVRDRSRSWTELEIWAALRLRRSVRAAQIALAAKERLRNELLERSNRELESFAFMVSHDLREPIRGIYTCAEILKEDYGQALGQEGSELTALVSDLTKRMDRLLSDLLEYARIGATDLSPTSVSTEELYAETVTLLGDKAAAIEKPSPLPPVYAHRSFVQEILTNLMLNAVKYTPGDDARIIVAPAPQHDTDTHVAFQVTDNGIGIAPENQDKIFQIFQRLHPPEEYSGGTGVGLTIARKMTERHQGRVWVESQPGEGSSFYFTLPKGPQSLPVSSRGD